MLGIKTFQDGSRLVVTIDGLEEMSKDEIAKKFLKSLVNDVSNASPAAALPIETTEEKVPQTRAFITGKYEGKTPYEVFAQAKNFAKKDEICKEFGGLASIETDPLLRQDIIIAGREFLKERFKNVDADEYTAKLSEKHVLLFYIYYSSFVDSDTIQYLCSRYKTKNWTGYLFSDEKDIREGIPYIIRTFQN